MVDRRVERGEATRERLIDAGRELFGKRGYEATSIEAVLELSGVARGSLYHHFATKQELFDAVLDRLVAEIAGSAAEAARAEADPLDSLRSGCSAWLRTALDPAVQRIALLDAPAVVGWTRWRELDERHSLRGLRINIERLAEEGRVPAEHVDLLTHMILASVGEAALMIAGAEDPDAALASGQAGVDLLLDRLASG